MDLVSQNLLMTSGGKKDPTYVEDVFSTYLWTGDGYSGRAISNGIKLSNNNAGNGVNFDANGDYLTTSSSSDYSMGTGDYTVECWVKINTSSGNYGIFQGGGLNTSYLTGPTLFYYVGSGLTFGNGAEQGSNTHPTLNQWFHVALVKNGSNTTLYYNGTGVKTVSDTHNYTNQSFALGGYYSTSYLGPVSISNFRVVKGTAVYTSSFTVPTEPLTNITNTKLLCCNQGSSVTAATVITGTLTVNGNPNISSGPFTADDGEGGMTWIKSRSTGNVNVLFDTVRGANQRLRSDSSLPQSNADTLQPSFTNSGFTVGSGNEVNGSGNKYTSWTFRKAPGFFDVVTWTGTDGNTDRVLSHSLKSIPGCVIIKCTSDASSWAVYHKSLGLDAFKGLLLEQNSTGQQLNKTVAISSTTFTARSSSNDLNKTYVAYLFAGGASTAATAPSLSFSGSNYLQVASSSDFAFGTGDFTMECWAKSTSNPGNRNLVSTGTDYGYIGIYSQNGRTSVQYVAKTTTPHLMSDGFSVARNQWFHVAVSRNSGVSRLFLNGQLCNTPASDPHDYPAGVVDIGRSSTSPHDPWEGNISNVRIVKGTGLYTSSFTPSTKPLENVSGTVLLCCNDSSPTGSTVTPGTITNNNSVTASTDTPFDDPAGYKFGEEGDQNIIKCGKITTDTTNGSYLDLPWEPQWILFKRTDATSNWTILDCMRGWTDYGTDWMLYPNLVNAESQGSGYEELLRNTIRFQGYGNNYDFVYMAIRRPEPLVSKPIEVATKAFHMLPSPPAGVPWYRPVEFPVDMSLSRQVTGTHNWDTGARIIEGRRLQTDNNNADTSGTYNFYDYQDGWNPYTGSLAGHVSWMWKRHAGFDIVPYIGNGQSGRQVKHSLGIPPEMMWVKSRDSSGNDAGWQVYHKGLGQTDNDPQGWNLQLNTNQQENWNNTGRWNFTVPASTHFTLGNYDGVNKNGDNMISMLFASVEGISKCGYYDGSNSEQTITTGFQPRFVIIKCSTHTEGWLVLDTTRGWGAGDDKGLFLNTADAQGTDPYGAPTSTGFTVVGNWNVINQSGKKYIYYAHA